LVASLFRLVLAPLDVIVAWRLDRSLRDGLAPERAWQRHPARWDPHGRFALPGLARLLAELRLQHPALALEAERVVAANPTRRRSVADAALLATAWTVERVTTLPALAALPGDLEPLDPGDLLSAQELFELDLLTTVGAEVAASREARSAGNRAQRLRAARRQLDARGSGSVLLARHRPRITQLVDEALRDAEAQRREREPVPQVYRVDGTPLDPETADMPTTFKGRGAIFERLEQLLGAPQRSTVLLHGPRRSGKTSLLKQLPRRLGPSTLPDFVDLQGDLGAAERPATLLGGLAHAITTQARSHRSLHALPALGIDALTDEPYVAFARWLDDLERALGDHHVLLCVDEFEQLQHQIDAGRLDTRILDLLRNVVQHRRRLTVALTGAHTLAELPPAWASRLVSTTAIEIGPLDEPNARQLVTSPVADFPHVFAPPAVDAILTATARQPFLLQVLCGELVEALNQRRWHEGDPPLDSPDVHAAIDAAVGRADHYFVNLWEEWIPEPARALVRRLAQDGRLPRATLDDRDAAVVDAVLILERRHVLTRTAGNSYELTVPLLAHYVRTRQTISP
jgi:hypothetical protein